MDIFIATSIKSFDLNPTHPGPLPRVSFHTSANQRIERSESKAARGRARRATNEVGDEMQKPASDEQDKLAGGKQSRGQETTSAEKRFTKQPQRLGDDFEFAFSGHEKLCPAARIEATTKTSAGPPASETEARLLGHRSCGGDPPRGQEALTQKARKSCARKLWRLLPELWIRAAKQI